MATSPKRRIKFSTKKTSPKKGSASKPLPPRKRSAYKTLPSRKGSGYKTSPTRKRSGTLQNELRSQTLLGKMGRFDVYNGDEVKGDTEEIRTTTFLGTRGRFDVYQDKIGKSCHTHLSHNTRRRTNSSPNSQRTRTRSTPASMRLHAPSSRRRAVSQIIHTQEGDEKQPTKQHQPKLTRPVSVRCRSDDRGYCSASTSFSDLFPQPFSDSQFPLSFSPSTPPNQHKNQAAQYFSISGSQRSSVTFSDTLTTATLGNSVGNESSCGDLFASNVLCDTVDEISTWKNAKNCTSPILARQSSVSSMCDFQNDSPEIREVLQHSTNCNSPTRR